MPPPRSNKVKVYVRTRPTNDFVSDILAVGQDNRAITIHRAPSQAIIDNKINDWTFHFDGVYNNVNQEELFNSVAKDIVNRTLDGYNGTIMCYGQTGAGKTHTMTGFAESYQNRGIIPRSLQHLYQEISTRQEFSYSIRIAYLEIYNDQMCDLLRTLNSQSEYQQQQQQLSIGEDSGLVYVKGLSYRIANNEEEALNLLFEGETNRAIGQHVLNKQSSRSHCLFTILIERRSAVSSDERYTMSKLNLVDLAGSERLAKTNSEGVTKREATFINKSLSFLEQAVLNLSDKKPNAHNCRSSKLTHALKDSIGGRCNTVMIANIWPEIQQFSETVSTLRFASRMMCVPAEPAVNEVIDPVKAIETYKRENKLLREELALHDSLINRSTAAHDALSEQQLHEIENQCRRFIDGTLDDIEVKNIRQIQAVFSTLKGICRATEKDVEKKCRDRYVPTDKHGYEQQDGHKNGTRSTGGDLDGQNYGSSKDQRAGKDASLKMSRGKRQSTSTAAGAAATAKATGAQTTNNKGKSPPPGIKTTGAALQRGVTAEDEQFVQVKETSDVVDAKDQRPSTPPGRAVAFDEFKQTRGSNLNRIYLENKEITATKKKQFIELARRINQAKAEIDGTRINAERKKNERLAMGEFLNDHGETIIDEEEYELIAKLQDLKGTYRIEYDQWKDLKSEITYCQNLLNQCQNRLLQEFDIWYTECYLNENNTGGIDDLTSSNKNNTDSRLYDDAAERFERMQRDLLLTDLDSMPFRQAQMKANRRHVFDAATAQGPWKQAPPTTAIPTSASYLGDNYDQEQQSFPSMFTNGNQQKSMVR